MKKAALLLVMFFSGIITAQNQTILYDDGTSGEKMIVGDFTREALTDTNFAWWFDTGYESYEPDLEALRPVLDDLKEIDFEIIMGTWCDDSRREVPRFLKIIDALNIQEIDVAFTGVDRDKQTYNNEIDGMNIQLVPTFIIYRGDEEIGRIEEAPKESLEKDITKIIITNKNNMED